ncbi:MAG: hypothetical protein WA635_11065 [Gallionella sp.]
MKWNKLHPVTAIICLTVVLLNGCGITEKIKSNYQVTIESYYAPDDLNADTQNTGLLLVDAVSEKSLNTMSLSGVAIVNTNKPKKIIFSGSFKAGSFLSQISGVVVIPNLQPGKYRIIKINTWSANMWETIFMPDTREYEIEISAGKPVYFGQIKVRQPAGSTDIELNIIYDKNRETEAWKMVVDKYNVSPWVKKINAHVFGL